MTFQLELSEEEIKRLWAEEAIRRDAELDSGAATSRDAKEVFQDARVRLLGRLSSDT